MTSLYLITGFLGAGKTTFLKNFIRYFPDRRVRLIINEFGRVGVDGALLREAGAAMDEIAGGSVFCTCRLDRFEETLDRAMAAEPPDVLLVEASGLSDPTAVRKILGADKYIAISYMGAICLVDAANFFKVLDTARVCAKQLSVSDLVLVNKSDMATDAQLGRIADVIRGRWPYADVRTTSFGKFEPEWLQALGRFGYGSGEEPHARDLTLQKCAIKISPAMNAEQLRHFIGMFIEETYRVKGFVILGDACWLADCTGAMISVAPWSGECPPGAGTLVALAGKGMNLREAVKKAAEWYPGMIDGVEMG